MLLGVAVTVVMAGVAVPESVTICGEFDALSVTAIFPVRFPADVGANAALIRQLAPAARVAGATGQGVVIDDDWVKFVLAVIAMVVAVLPVFVTVIAWVALVWSTAVDGKERGEGVAVTVVAPLGVP
jgi:hypothetical protein